jgi:hypothetical protein
MNPTTPFSDSFPPETAGPAEGEIPFEESDPTVIDPNSFQFPEMP